MSNIIFFGTPDFSVTILKHMHSAGFTPSLIVTAPDKKIGRKQVLTPPAVKQWADVHGIETLQPQHPKEIIQEIRSRKPDLCIVAAYGYIISQELLDIPKHGTLNVHTSLLPKYRGACPIESAILHADEVTGSTIMLMDAKMDHGPIISQKELILDPHIDRVELFKTLSNHGGELLVETLTPCIHGTIDPVPQDHTQASFCYKIKKSDGDVSNDNDHTKYRKYLAYKKWPGIFYFDNGKRIKITEAQWKNNRFVMNKVIPEGKKEMDYQQYLGK